jgi:hypothetical protein
MPFLNERKAFLTRVRDNRTLISLKSMSYKFKIRI